MIGIEALRHEAKQLADAGDTVGAARLYAQAARREPNNGPLLNGAGNFHFGIGDYPGALVYFDRALALLPDDLEPLLNRALALSRLDRAAEALVALTLREQALGHYARYWAVRASIERQQNHIDAAAVSYERCLTLDASHQRALHGRARVALERGENNAAGWFERLLATQKGDAQAWLGYAQALDGAGQSDKALEIGRALVRQAPGWVDALQFLVELNWSRGDRQDFCRPYADAARQNPKDMTVISAWCEALAGVDRHAEAATIAGDMADRQPNAQHMRLAEAAYAGAAGDDDRAEQIFSRLPLQGVQRQLHEARHRLRLKQPDRAERLLADCLAHEPDSVAAWALRDIAWRMLGDTRHTWLHGQHGLVQLCAVDIPASTLNRITDLLHQLHDSGSMPLGQSIRAGTQTRGALFARQETGIIQLRHYLNHALERYRTVLPPEDGGHPLLRYRDSKWAITGSWSIRAQRGGRHSEHIHPQGIVSSAFYLVLPGELPSNDELGGALELGRPPRDLRLDLPPLAVIRPRVGHCALFPSTLYHGTRPFEQGERMTVAFDISLAG